MENNICSKMYDAVTAMCSFVAEENIKRVQNLIGEVKRYFPIFAKLLSSDDVLRDADETNLRKLRDWITCFEEEENPRLKNIPEWLDDKTYKDYLSLLSMVKETIKGYFVPPTFEPQQLEQTYKLLFANRLAIAEVMGISADSFANKLEKWLRQDEASQSDKKKEFRDILKDFLTEEEITKLLEQLPKISVLNLKRWYDRYLQGKIGGKEFFDLCEDLVCRTGERGWNYNNFKSKNASY